MIVIEDLRKSYGERVALDGVSLTVPKGQLFAYLGPNGAGKSTTIRILTGLTKRSGGRASLDGCDIEADALAARRRSGLVPQQTNLDNDLSVGENLDIHGRLFDMRRGERQDRIAEVLAYVELADRRDQTVRTLSGGMKRRVMIARALMHRPAILFLDEPTAGLDAQIRRRIWALIKRIRQDGTTIFLTTHHIEEAEFLAERVAFLDQGRIVVIDSPANLINRVGAWAVDVLGEEDMETEYFATRAEADHGIRGRDGSVTIRRVNLEDAFLAMTGRKV
ncbi:MAG: ABC transporter ATP-binding protein [Telmatospirillum sp.]|nr:ABC transporter ATP-binding protein [Telmatospirillum sp.]